MEVYLDNSATTRAFDCVAEIVTETMTNEYGNSSSMHLKGVSAERYIKRAKEVIAKTLKVNEKEIFFTSGGTESDNWALIGAAGANSRAGKHIISTAVEHPAVSKTLEYLGDRGFCITYLPVDGQGKICLEDLRRAIRPDTILVSIMHVNNEVGSLQPVEEAGALIKRINPQTLFHVDAVQSFGKFRIYPKKCDIDMLSVSGHKIHGPKGVGFLYIDEKVKIRPMIYGGGQQRNYRSGTENVSGIAGLGRAVEEIYKNFKEDTEKLYAIREYFVSRISEMEGMIVNGPRGNEGAPHVVSVSVSGIRSEVLLHALEEKGICISAGSACSAGKHTLSPTLKSMGISKDLSVSTVRFSFSVFTTIEELKYTLDVLAEIVPMLRKYTRH